MLVGLLLLNVCSGFLAFVSFCSLVARLALAGLADSEVTGDGSENGDGSDGIE